MRKVFSNTTPILNLLKIDQLLLLKQLYQRILIPRGVFLEIERGKERPFYQDLSTINWINILPLDENLSHPQLPDHAENLETSLLVRPGLVGV